MLKLNHLTGFGSGAAAAVVADDVTSYVFDGTGDYLSIPDHADWDFPQGDFTIECFIRIPVAPPADDDFLYGQFVDTNNFIKLNYYDNGAVNFYIKEGGASVVNVTSNLDLLTADTWMHIVVCRDGDNYYIYVDGTDQTASGSPDSTTPSGIAGDVYIGARDPTNAYKFIGYMDEFRISDTARYPSGTGFTPTITQFTSDANTLLLIHGGEAIASGTTGSGATFVDSGNTGHTVTENGDAIRDTSIYKF